MLGVSFVIWLTVVVDFGYVEEFVWSADFNLYLNRPQT